MSSNELALPLHPTMRHPLTGQPLRALYVDKHGHARYPIMGGAPEGGDGGEGGQGTGGGNAGQGSSGSGQGGTGSGSGQQGSGSSSNGDLGFPKDTPIVEMTPEQQAAYWKHQSRKHESTWKDLVGDRKVDDVKNDLTEYERIRQEQLTPSEKAIQEAEQRGRQAATRESHTLAAKAILRANLETRGIKDTDDDQELSDLVDSIDVSRFITDGDIDTSKLLRFAARFAPADNGQGQQQRRREWGGGERREGTPARGSAGRAMAEKRFGTKTS